MDVWVLTLQPGLNQHHSTLEGNILTTGLPSKFLQFLLESYSYPSLPNFNLLLWKQFSFLSSYLIWTSVSKPHRQKSGSHKQFNQNSVTSFTQHECSSDQIQMAATQYPPLQGEMGEQGSQTYSFWFSVGQWCPAGVPNLWDQISDDLSWSWCNNNKNKVHNKCNAFESSWNDGWSLPLVHGKIFFHKIGPWCQKG